MQQNQNNYQIGNYYFPENKSSLKSVNPIRILGEKNGVLEYLNLKSQLIRFVHKDELFTNNTLYLSKEVANLMGFKIRSYFLCHKKDKYYCISYETEIHYLIHIVNKIIDFPIYKQNPFIHKRLLISKEDFKSLQDFDDLYNKSFNFVRVEELFVKLNDLGYNINCDEVVKSIKRF